MSYSQGHAPAHNDHQDHGAAAPHGQKAQKVRHNTVLVSQSLSHNIRYTQTLSTLKHTQSINEDQWQTRTVVSNGFLLRNSNLPLFTLLWIFFIIIIIISNTITWLIPERFWAFLSCVNDCIIYIQNNINK